MYSELRDVSSLRLGGDLIRSEKLTKPSISVTLFTTAVEVAMHEHALLIRPTEYRHMERYVGSEVVMVALSTAVGVGLLSFGPTCQFRSNANLGLAYI